ncbi:MAG: PadR family transcriptional regulator [bacterium]
MTPTIGELELAALLTVARLGHDAYGASIRRDLSARAERDYAVGAIYTTMQRLEDKRLVTSSMSEPTAVRGGRAKRCFRLTALGGRVLAQQRQMKEALWKGVPTGLGAT